MKCDLIQIEEKVSEKRSTFCNQKNTVIPNNEHIKYVLSKTPVF